MLFIRVKVSGNYPPRVWGHSLSFPLCYRKASKLPHGQPCFLVLSEVFLVSAPAPASLWVWELKCFSPSLFIKFLLSRVKRAASTEIERKTWRAFQKKGTRRSCICLKRARDKMLVIIKQIGYNKTTPSGPLIPGPGWKGMGSHSYIDLYTDWICDSSCMYPD